MLEKIKEKSLVIVKDEYKTQFIKRLRESGDLFDIKILGLKEFKKKFYFDYTKETVFYVHKKYGCIKEIAEIYIDNLYYVSDIDEPKMNFLNNLLEDLKSQNLIEFDEPFKKYLSGRTVVLYNLKYVDEFYEKMFKELSLISNVERLDEETSDFIKKPLYKFSNKDSETGFVASQIAQLIKKGVPIDKIKLANVNDDYMFSLKTTFDAFHIPIELDFKESISSTIIVETFKENYESNIQSVLEKVKPLVKTDRDEKIYKMILDVLNEYVWCEDYMEVKDFIFEDLDSKTMPIKPLKHAIRSINFMTDTLCDDEFVFLINFNQGTIPQNYKDENYLNDEIRRKLGISDSIDLNKKALLSVQEKISQTKNLMVTYSTRNLQGELYISNAYKEELFNIEEHTADYTHSDDYNKRILVKEKDENRKYGTVTEALKILGNHYQEEAYLNFDNSFKGISRDKLNTLLQNKLTLSYSNMNSFYHCSFRYYLDNIIKVDKFEDTFEIVVGNIFHEVLSHAFEENFDFEDSWSKALEHAEFPFGAKENFFLTILKDELLHVIEEITSQKEYTALDKALYEQKITVPLKEGRVEFKGFVDKIMYTDNTDNKVVSIVDYKTGHPELNIDNCLYGLDMQLPIYAYLIKNYEKFKDATIGGFYLQKILNNIKAPDQKKESLKLQGYSNSNTEILNLVDKSFTDSKMIKSLRTGSNGFYSYSKVLSNREIDKLIKLVETKIDEAATAILEGSFAIDPKQVGDSLVGCKFCKYKDICYMNNKDIKKLNKVSKKDFLGGETDANLD